MNKKLPEEVVFENVRTLRLFQYIPKKLSFDWCEYETKDKYSGEISKQPLQNVNRAFAYNSDEVQGMIYKYKRDKDGIKKAKVSSLPESVFIYNNEILSDEAIDKIIPQIDYQYYIDRAYERIAEFIKIKVVKDINL